MTAWDFKADDKGMTYPEPMDAIPAEFAEEAELRRQELLEAAADCDDDLMEKVLMEEEVTVEELKAALRKGTIACQIHPVFVGSSYKNKGVQELLDAVVDYMPSPVDIPAIKGTNPDTGAEDERPSDVKAPFSALAFKIMTDPFVGKLTYLRVYSGSLDSGSYIMNASKDKKERIGRLLQMHSNQRVDIDGCAAGDIVAVVGLKDTSTGDTLCDADHPIILESMEFAEPVIDIAVEPKTKAEQDKMGIALQKLAEEDPTFRVSTNQETGQTIIAGMGELHLEIIVDRLLREFKVEANVGKPQVAYRETATQEARNVEGKFVRQSGGRGQYGHAVINLIPQEAGKEMCIRDSNATFSGRAAHAGVCPEEGVSAIAMAAAAVSSMPLGRLDEATTANVGFIEGGGATNVVPDTCALAGECRSLYAERAEAQKEAMTEALEAAAARFGGAVSIEWTKSYDAVLFDEEDELVQAIVRASRAAGLEPRFHRSGGGSDANVLAARGVRPVTLGVGMAAFHSVDEHIAVDDLEGAARLVEALIAEGAQ